MSFPKKGKFFPKENGYKRRITMKNVKPKFSTDLDAANSWYLAWRSTSFRTNARFHGICSSPQVDGP